ncbi:nucleoside diphosphate kinase homolog 5-like [Parasteatoda tepidariorum]|uniref:nucleoside diphosphate kinase homolog 5-like n=1 Tax=Parasteatoda tepidariorum TaxID=114398 RepID=UPI00077FC8D7|nr:nucleoside diphosphate kinase homolog 5-like [Parasteatoda tepidariorum]
MNVVYEKTLGIITPKLISRTSEIEWMIKSSGLAILKKKIVLLRRDQAQRFFYISGGKEGKHDPSTLELEKANFDDDDVERDLKAFIYSMTTGHSEVLIIAGFDAVSRWLELIGQANTGREQANCINVLFGNGVLGSKNVRTASREIRFFFPDTQFEAELSLGSAREYLSETVNPHLLKGLVILCKEKPQIPVLWLARWLLKNRPYEY